MFWWVTVLCNVENLSPTSGCVASGTRRNLSSLHRKDGTAAPGSHHPPPPPLLMHWEKFPSATLGHTPRPASLHTWLLFLLLYRLLLPTHPSSISAHVYFRVSTLFWVLSRKLFHLRIIVNLLNSRQSSRGQSFHESDFDSVPDTNTLLNQIQELRYLLMDTEYLHRLEYNIKSINTISKSVPKKNRSSIV